LGRIFGGLWWFTKRLVQLILVLILLFYVLLWIPAVQNWLGQQFANVLSNAWDTKVTIGRATMTPVTNVKFYDFYIEDHHQDTLIFAKYVEAGRYNIFSLFQKTVDIGDAIVHDAVFKVQRLPHEKDFNIQFIIEFFQGPDDGVRREKFKFSMHRARLRNARFHFYDAAVGTALTVTSEKGYVDANEVDMIGKKAWGDTACLENSKVFVHIFDRIPIPDVDSSFWEVPFDSTIPYWDVLCNKVHVKNLDYKLLNNRIGVDNSRSLDFSNLHLDDIDLRVDSFRLKKERFTGWVRELHGKDHKGFEIKSLTGHGDVSPTKLAATQFRLETNNSVFGDSLVFHYDEYKDFFDFVDKVKVYSTLDNCRFTFGDLAAFAPKILNNKFIAANQNKVITVDGTYKGKINNFKARNLDVSIGNSHIRGNVSMNDITIPEAAFMDLVLKEVKTNYNELRDLLPFVRFPKQIKTLGTMSFKGSYTGFFQDFVAFGELNTRLGSIKSDLKLNLTRGKQGAAYSGGLRFANFDIGTFLDQKDLVGRISLQTQIEGTGLTLETLDARLKNAKIDSFEFKKYKYENVLVDGQFKQKRFEGDIISKDQNVNFVLKGIMDLNGELPKVDILGNVECIDFQRINITNEYIGLHIDTFDIEAVGSNVDNFEGTMSVRGIQGNRGEVFSALDKIYIEAEDVPRRIDTTWREGIPILMEPRGKPIRKITLRSDVANANVYGNYDVVNLVRSIEQFFRDNHPNLFKNLNYTAEDSVDIVDNDASVGDFASQIPTIAIGKNIPHQDFNIVVDIKDSKNLTQLINPNFKSLKDIYLTGSYNGSEEEMLIDGEVGFVHFGDIAFNDIKLDGEAYQNEFSVNNKIGSMLLKDTTFLPQTQLYLDAVGDSVIFRVFTSSIADIASDIAIKGKLEVEEQQAILRLDTSNLRLLGIDWTINDDNFIRIGDKSLTINNIRLESDKKLVVLSSIKNRGINAYVENIDLGWLYHLGKPLPQIDLDGIFSADVSIHDIFTQKGIEGRVLIDTLLINDDYWGSNSTFYVQADSIKSTFSGLFVHSSDFADTLYARANFTPSFATEEPSLSNMLDINVTAQGAKAKIIHYFMKNQISNTTGYANAKARIYGQIQGKKTLMNIEGDGELIGVATTVDFLKTRYVLNDGDVLMDNTGFHIAPELTLRDGNLRESGGIPFVEINHPEDTAYVGGSLTHDHLRDFGLDITAAFENTLVLNTQKGDNNVFYGTVYSTGTANFSGPFNKLKLDVDGTSRPNSQLVIPLGEPVEVAEKNYITFVDKKKEKKDSINIKQQVWRGLDVNIVAHATPDINMKLIFDEKSGDIMQGTGFGDLNIIYNSSGEFKMFGDYKIEKGNYLFTYKNLLNKPFKVKKGGTVSWGADDGSPYKARLNVQAEYEKSLSLTNLVSAYTVNNADLNNLASKPSDVDLLMNLKGELLSPDITFDINIDDVDARLRSYVDLALRTIKSDNNELNRQVFGIIALQQFLPLENAQDVNVVSSGISTGISTLSELVSQQLSLYLNDLLAEVIEDVDFISNFELDLNFNYRDDAATSIEETAKSNVRVGGDVSLLNNRLRVYLGANMDIAGNNNTGAVDGTDANQNYIGGDFIVEYYITENGQLKIRGYNRTESTILGRSTRTGIGISYRKEFDTFKDLINDMKKSLKSSKTKRLEKKRDRLDKKLKKYTKLLEETTDPKKQEKYQRKVDKFQQKLNLTLQELVEHKKRLPSK